jgi:hypothetical protein
LHPSRKGRAGGRSGEKTQALHYGPQSFLE